jgi:hypothetical protein
LIWPAGACSHDGKEIGRYQATLRSQILVIAEPAFVAAVSTGRTTLAIMTAGAVVWAIGECPPYPKEGKFELTEELADWRN